MSFLLLVKVREGTVAEQRDKILVVDPNPEECNMLVEAALEPFGYAVQATADGSAALSMILESPPDALILDLDPEGLSAQDILAALNAQALDLPVIILADEGAERKALQAFRLGAKDYVVRPIREAELIQVVERALKEVRMRRERETLVGEVRYASGQAEQRLRELRTLMSIGKSVTALRQLDEVFDRVIRAALQMTQAEAVGVFIRDDETGALILRAGQNLSRKLLDQMGQAVEDDLASLVMNSRETYLADGDGLRKFRPAQEDAQAVIYAPLVIHEKAIGLLWVANTRLPFRPYMKDLMTALADYAAIAVVNVRLFTTMQERTRQLEAMYQRLRAQRPGSEKEASLAPELAAKLRAPLTDLLGNMNLFRTGEMGALSAQHQAAVDVMHRELQSAINLLDSLVPPDTGGL